MGLLNWVEADVATSRKFLKAEIVNLSLDFIDLCKDRFWGSSSFAFQLKFSIHERIIKDKGWAYQLLAPNGIHVYCKDVEEAKEMAELMYRRIIGALSEQIQKSAPPPPETKVVKRLNNLIESGKAQSADLNATLYRRHCRNIKHKTDKLFSLLKKRGIDGRVYYSRLRRHYGWMFVHQGGAPLLIGSNYQQAVDFVQSGSLDFYGTIGEVG